MNKRVCDISAHFWQEEMIPTNFCHFLAGSCKRLSRVYPVLWSSLFFFFLSWASLSRSVNLTNRTSNRFNIDIKTYRIRRMLRWWYYTRNVHRCRNKIVGYGLTDILQCENNIISIKSFIRFPFSAVTIPFPWESTCFYFQLFSRITCITHKKY